MATHPLWSAMSPVLANEILLSTQQHNKKLYRTAVEILAPAMGRRVPKILEMPKVERHAYFVQLLANPQSETLSFNLLSQWFIHDQVPLLCAWLDALGIEHDGEGCADEFPPAPDRKKLEAAVDKLLADHDHAVVAVYLTTFNDIDEVGWKDLADILRTDKRLQLDADEEEAEASSGPDPETTN